MSEELQNEVEAINSIYGDGTLQRSTEPKIYILHLPERSISLRLEFPDDYPAAQPDILGSETSGDNTRKGEAARLVKEVKTTLSRVYRHGEVCLFDLLEELGSSGNADNWSIEDGMQDDQPHDEKIIKEMASAKAYEIPLPMEDQSCIAAVDEPPWMLSEVVSEKKSVFVARSATVSSPAQAKEFLEHLKSTDKKVAKATHNITAWRIKGMNGVTFQDCDDDGEAAAGGRLLHLMQLMDVWNVMLVVSRWYGGVQLGPDRFRIINSVARDALMRGEHIKEQPITSPGGKKKRKK